MMKIVEKFITIHLLDLFTNCAMSMGHRHVTTAHASRIIFLPKLCQPVSTIASPKHPQSLTGSAMASQSVSGVNSAITASVSLDVNLRLMAKSMLMPSRNSTADDATDRARVSIGQA